MKKVFLFIKVKVFFPFKNTHHLFNTIKLFNFHYFIYNLPLNYFKLSLHVSLKKNCKINITTH